jgi:hypothetical protein
LAPPGVVVVAVVAPVVAEAGLPQLAAELALEGVAPVLSLAPETGSLVLLHPQGRQSFSAATARIYASPQKPTCERALRSK